MAVRGRGRARPPGSAMLARMGRSAVLGLSLVLSGCGFGLFDFGDDAEDEGEGDAGEGDGWGTPTEGGGATSIRMVLGSTVGPLVIQ